MSQHQYGEQYYLGYGSSDNEDSDGKTRYLLKQLRQLKRKNAKEKSQLVKELEHIKEELAEAAQLIQTRQQGKRILTRRSSTPNLTRKRSTLIDWTPNPRLIVKHQEVVVEAVRSYYATPSRNVGHLYVRKGDIIRVKYREGEYFKGKNVKTGEIGIFPSNVVKEMSCNSQNMDRICSSII